MAAAPWDVIDESDDQWAVADETPDITPGVAGVSSRMRAAQLEADRKAMTHPAERRVAPWSDVLATVPGEIKATAAEIVAGAKLREFEELARVRGMTPELADNIAREQAILREIEAERRDVLDVPNTTVLQRGVKSGLVSLPVAAPALGAGILTRNPAIAAAAMYPATRAQTYGQLRTAGVDPEQAGWHADFQGVVESGTELLPFAQLLGSLPAGQMLLRTLAAELPGESIAQLSQGASDYVARAQAGGRELDATLALEGLAEASKALPETWVATLVATALQTGGVAGVNRVAAAEDRMREPKPQERGLGPESFIAPEGWQIVSETPVAEAVPEQPAVAEAAPVEQPVAPQVEQPAAELPPGFEVVGEERDPLHDAPLEGTALESLREKIKSDESVRSELTRMLSETGWDTVGGKRLGEDETRGAIKEVPGRTMWLPKADWWPGRPGQYNEGEVKKIIAKALTGQKLGPTQQLLVDYMAEIADMRVRLKPAMPTNQELIQIGELKPTPDNQFEVALAARAAAIDEEAFEQLVKQYQDDDAGFLRALKEFVDAYDQSTEAGRSSEGDSETPQILAARVPDLFGQDVAQQEALNKRNAALERKRGIGRAAVPAEIKGRGDLFGEAEAREAEAERAKQTDIESISGKAQAETDALAAKVLSQPGMEAAVREDTLKNRKKILGEDEEGDVLASRQGQAGATYAPLFQSVGLPAAAPASRALTLGARAQPQRTVAIPDKPISRAVAIDLIERAFGMKIYQGKPFMGRMLGFYRPKTGEVRIKKHNDLEVAAHEFFHWLDRHYGSIRSLYHMPQFRDELKGVSYDVKKIFEGFAEFGRLYMTQEVEAAMRAPRFYDAFVQEAARLGILKQLNQAQEVMHTWYQQGAEQRALSKIGKPEYPLEARLERLTHRIVDRAIARGADYLQAAKVIEREIAGDIQDATVSPYKSLRLLAGGRMIANQFINRNTLTWKQGDLVATGHGLLQIFNPVADVMPETIGYFVGRRAAELKGQGKEQLLDADEIKALLALPDKVERRADIERAFAEFQKFNSRVLDFAEDSGILNSRTRSLWEQIYENYVPFMRVTETIGSPDVERSGGIFKRLKGGTQNLNDILENIVSNVEGIVRASLRNVAKRQLYDLIESIINGQKWAVRIPEGVKPIMIGMDQIAGLLRQLEAQAMEQAEPGSIYFDIAKALEIVNNIQSMDPDESPLADLQAQATFFIGHQQPGILNKDFYLKNGKPVWFQIGDPLLWDMVVELNTVKPLAFVEEMLSLSKNVLTRSIVSTPTFQLRNIARDTFNALTLGRNFKLPIIDTMTSLAKVYTDSPEFQEFLNNGGGFGFAIHSDVRRVKLKLERARHAGKINTAAIIDTPDRLLEAYDTISQAGELANRLAEFRRAKEAGFSSREAAYRGREIGTDFGMRGNSNVYRYFALAVPFGSARLQGLYRIEREILEHKGKQTPKALVHATAIKYAAKSLLWITLPSLVLYLMNKDEDWYKEQNDATRDLNWLFKTESGRVVRVPKPFETGMLFGTMAERLWQYAETKNDRELMKAAEFLIVQTFSMEGLPQLVRPVYDLAMNEDYRGAPIIPEYLRDVVPEEQFTPYTSQAIIAAARKFDVSPIKLEYLIRGYFGYLGGYAIMTADSVLSPKTSGVRPERDLSEYPVLEGFLKSNPARSTEYEQAFYELAGKINEVVATVRKQKADGRVDDLAAYLGDSEQEQYFALQGGIEAIKANVNLITAEMRRVRFDPNLTASEKKAKIAFLQLEKNKLFREAVQGIGASDLEQLRDYLEWKP